MDAGRRTADLLERRPELESAVEAVLAVDSTEDAWTFEDVPIDSGAFGELVAEGVVVDADGGGYRVAEPETVRRVLTDEDGGEFDSSREIGGLQRLRSRWTGVDLRGAALLLGSLAVVLAVRSLPVARVFRGEHVVLSGNDPYFYRYWTEAILAGGGVDWGLVTNLPGSVASGEPLLVATLGFVAGLFGGTGAAGVVLALYPVVAALLAGGALYLLSVRVTGDRRAGLAAVVLLAIVPGHAFRTSLGYADHHAFDYVWLVLTALALAVLLDRRVDRSLRRVRTWVLAGALGLAVAAQVLAWEGGPLLLLPIGVVVLGRSLLALRTGHSPGRDLAPTLCGLWLAGVLSLAIHGVLGWHATTVAGAPLLVAAGGTGVTALAEGGRRAGRTAREVLVVETALGGTAMLGLWLALPAVWSGFVDVFALVTREGTTSEAVALFSSSFGFFTLFSPFLLGLAVAVLVWATGRIVRGEDSLLVPATYAWLFLAISLFQVRFVGELAPFAALFAGLGFVWVAAWVDLAVVPPPFSDDPRSFRSWLPERPDPRTIGYVFALFVLIGGVGLVQSAIKVDQISVDDETYQTAAWMEDYAGQQDRAGVGESYVFSQWDVNRLFNYFVNGDSRSYGYALNNYRSFLVETDAESAYRSHESRVAFVLTQQSRADAPTVQALLHERLGSRGDGAPGSGHFRALFASESGRFKVFTPVEGALLTGTAPSNATVTARADVSISGATFTYERQAVANATGEFTVRVANPGTYTVRVGEETRELTVDVGAVEAGERVRVDP